MNLGDNPPEFLPRSAPELRALCSIGSVNAEKSFLAKDRAAGRRTGSSGNTSMIFLSFCSAPKNKSKNVSLTAKTPEPQHIESRRHCSDRWACGRCVKKRALSQGCYCPTTARRNTRHCFSASHHLSTIGTGCLLTVVIGTGLNVERSRHPKYSIRRSSAI